jgi:ABC-2 type transport system permease protein
VLRLFYLDYRRTLRDRKTWLALGMLVYAVVSMPLVVEKPPPHVKDAMTEWFGDATPFAVFMFVWIDLAMNKVIAFVPAVLASGVVLTERDTGVLAILAAKPLGLPRYFMVRAVSVCLVMLSLHVLTQLLGLVWFPGRITGFQPAAFALAMTLHAFAAVFATALCAMLAMVVGKRSGAVLLGIAILGTLVGVALIGFYQPAWRTISYLNPVTLGSLSVGSLDALDLSMIGPPIVALLAMTGAALVVGARFAARMEAAS